MQYDVDNPNSYLESLDLDWRKEKLEKLRQIILKQSEDMTECINYKMLCYKLNGITLFHLNAQKGYVSLYVGNVKKIDPDNELLKGLNVGKGCIRFTKTKNISSTRIDEFISNAIELGKRGVDLGC